MRLLLDYSILFIEVGYVNAYKHNGDEQKC